ncbi:hypothetical protein AB6D86_24920, partial [Vibrio splendidus]
LLSMLFSGSYYILDNIYTGNLYSIDKILDLNSSYALQVIEMQDNVNTKLISIEKRLTILEKNNTTLQTEK